MEILLEVLLWPVGEAVCSICSGFWSILERSGDNGSEKRLPRAAVARGPCAYCRRKGGEFLACRACRAPHHADCARLNRRCAVYACRGGEFRAPAA